MKVLHRIENPLNQQQSATPLYLEMQSHPRHSPYMVTASSVMWLWIDGNSSGRIRAAFRYRNKEFCEEGLFQCVLSQANEYGWGWANVFSTFNVDEAKAFLNQKGYPDVELWVGKNTSKPNTDLTVRHFDWDTPYWFILPCDRKLFGWISEDGDQYVGVVFDPLNSMCILHPRFVQGGR